MSDLVRLSLSIEQPLFDQLEKLVRKSGYVNRSEFVRDLIRDRLVRTEWDKDEEVLGTITLVYDHHRRQLAEKLIDLQHHHHTAVLVTTHVHLTQHLCAEVILVRGRAHLIQKLADLIHQQKGVLHSELSMTSTGAELH
ncbi:MAG: nickel-responsive transcriptional regulator NikR [Planctomycetes bacterium]|nr:nickel-responsive transcriptional regulator NikR [Planctomycetota bacterium]